MCVCVLYENSRFKSTIDHWQCEWRKLSEKKTHRNGFERPPMEYFLLNAFLFRHRDHCEHTWLFCCLNHTRAVCSDLFSALFFSFDFSYKIHRFSSMVVIPFVSYRLVRFGFFSVCVCVSLFLRILLFNVSMLMIRIIMREEREKNQKLKR